MNRSGFFRNFAVLTLGTLIVVCSGAALADGAADLPRDEVIRLGENMYRQGLLPSGKPMKAFVNGDVPVEGSAFTCVSCHLRSGLGSIEGGIVTPPTNGRILYKDRTPTSSGPAVPLIHKYATLLPPRPAYTDKTLAMLLTTGIDPSGRDLKKAMPVYQLDEGELSILISYLKTLSDKPPEGVSAREVNFATVIVEGSDPVAVESMIAPIQFTIDRKNSLARASAVNRKVALMGQNMLGPLHAIEFTLERWVLKGEPDSWRAQLDSYYKEKPVFALLGGISPTTWEPVHRFCEERGIPNLFPIVKEPVLSATGFYTFYLSRGPRQEGEAAARYLHSMFDLFGGKPILQLTRDSQVARSLAAGFDESWAATGHAPVASVLLPEGELLSAGFISNLLAERKPAALVLWDDASALAQLEAVSSSPDKPGLVILSTTAVGEAFWNIPEKFRSLVYLTYPYRLPQDDLRFDPAVKRVFAGKKADGFDLRTVKMSYVTSELLGDAFTEMRGEYFRDFFLETVSMMKDMYFPLYERISFGPGQRYASKGSFLVQLGKGEKPVMEKKSEWFTH